jgi:hypothetical protein
VNTQRGSRARAFAVLGAVVSTVLALGLTLAPAASAADVGISGTVRDGTTGEVVAGLPVTVTFFDASRKLGIDKQTTAADGTFTSIPPASAAGYQVTATFKGTEYRTQATQLLSGQPSVVTLEVFAPTSDPGNVATTQAVLWVDREGDGFAVQEDYGWKNSGKTAYVGKGGSVVSLPLPKGATNLQFLGTFLEQRGTVKDGVYVSDAPIVPGKSTATIRFTVGSLDTISLPVTFPTTGIQLFVPQGITVSATGVRLAGTIQDTGADGQPVTYQQYVIDGPPVGTTVDVALAATGTADAGRTDWTTILLVIAGLAALAAVVFAIVGRRRAAQRTPAKTGRAPKVRPATRPSKAAPATRAAAPAKTRTANGHRSEPPKRTASVAMPAGEEDDVQLLVDEIAALDLSFENGVLDERTYRRLRVAAKDRLLLAQEASARGVPR